MLRASSNGSGATIEVRDSGPGIPPDVLRRIFEPGFSTKSNGMGLGLAIVEGIVRGHGGAIEARSEPGRGATFTLRLPRLAAPRSTEENGG